MVNTEQFFSKSVRRAQSDLKHGILGSYLAAFASKTGSTSAGNRVGFVDGYSGPGEYVHSGSGLTTEGSPKIALRVAADLAKNRRPTYLECMFVEQKKEYFESVAALASAAPTVAKAFHGDVKTHLNSALSQFKGIPALVFLDPFGAGLDRETCIKDILSRDGTAPTELLMNFSLEAIRRTGPWVKKPVGTTSREAMLKTMDLWLGGDWWQDIFQKVDPSVPDAVDTAASEVANEYARRVHQRTGCGVFPVPMRRAANHKPLFTLMLFFPRSVAVFPYNEAVSLAQDKWREAMWGLDIAAATKEVDRNPILGGAYIDSVRAAAEADKEQFKTDTIATVRESIRTTLASQNSISMKTECSRAFGSAMGTGRSLHLRAAWDELTAAGITEPRDKSLKSLERAVIRKVDRQLPSF